MKVTPRSDYPVRVRPRSWEEEPAVADRYDGIFEVTLNNSVTITFTPELAPDARPFDRGDLPASLDDIDNSASARLESVLFADRAVTPDDGRAGTFELLPIPDWNREADAVAGVVFYVTPREFAEVTADLDLLRTTLGSVHSDTPVSALRGHPAIDFIEKLIARPEFGEQDMVFLRDPQ